MPCYRKARVADLLCGLVGQSGHYSRAGWQDGVGGDVRLVVLCKYGSNRAQAMGDHEFR